MSEHPARYGDAKTRFREPQEVTELQNLLIRNVTSCGASRAAIARESGHSRAHVYKLLNGTLPGSMETWNNLLIASNRIKQRQINDG